MSLCIAAAGAVVSLAVNAFTLSWTHTVEKVAWREDWAVEATGLRLVAARVKGSGAGMEPPDGASFDGEGWSWRPALPPQREVVLAASAAGGLWRLCAAGDCRDLGGDDGAPVVLSACPPP